MNFDAYKPPEYIPPPQGPEQSEPLYPTLAHDCTQFLDALPAQFTAVMDNAERATFVGREVAFVSRVHNAVTDLAASHEGPITVLLDVDETFASVRFVEETNTFVTYTRPGLPTLLTSLDNSVGDRYDIGLLTTRSHHGLMQELTTPQYGFLLPFGARLNRDFIVSSRGDSPVYDQEPMRQVADAERQRAHGALLAVVRAILRRELAEPPAGLSQPAERTGIPDWYDSKLAILAHIAAANPDRGFVFADDLPFVSSIDPAHPRLRGVELGNTAKFSLPHV